MRNMGKKMRIQYYAAAGILAAVLFLQIFKVQVWAGNMDRPGELHALSAVLMDGESGRILYGKEPDVPRPNASTTKVLTCIVALEEAELDEIVEVSAKAAAQPDVQLHIRQGEKYYLGDLLYSLMLKSHNDSAVAIAEHIGGSVEAFARMMNCKAKEIGCRDTHFVTPNGLDSKDEQGVHHTTAGDLALIMRYAVKNEEFLKITQTRTHTFADLSRKRSFTIQNANAFLDMMEGVLSGKTGYTGEAGYCYVCAWKKGEKLLIVSLLGCGWPNHKTYKWSDAKRLLHYGDANYELCKVWKTPVAKSVLVKGGESSRFGETLYIKGKCEISQREKEKRILLKKGEELTCRINLPAFLEAPVKEGQEIGRILYFLGEKKIASYPVVSEKSVKKITYKWYVDKVFHNYFH